MTAVEGDWLVALRQDQGRGRQGRIWQGATGNFAGSTLVDLRRSDPPAAALSLVAGLALFDAIATLVTAARLTLKWPNDLLLDGAKLAGILLERTGDRVVVGIGVNLAEAPAVAGRRTAALAPAAVMAPAEFAPLLADHFHRLLGAWRIAEAAAFARAWEDAAHPRGTALTVHGAPGETISGRFDGIEPDGTMRLRLADGTIRPVHAGDVDLV